MEQTYQQVPQNNNLLTHYDLANSIQAIQYHQEQLHAYYNAASAQHYTYMPQPSMSILQQYAATIDTRKTSKPKRSRTVYTSQQLAELEYEFHHNPQPSMSHQPTILQQYAATTATTKTSKPKRSRTVYTSQQLAELEYEFQHNPYLYSTRRAEIANRLDLGERQIKVWFQNRRIKQKKLNSGQLIHKTRIDRPPQNPHNEIVQRLMSYTQDAQTAIETNEIKVEVDDNDNAGPMDTLLEFIKFEPRTIQAPKFDLTNDIIDLTDVLDCVNADQQSTSASSSPSTVVAPSSTVTSSTSLSSECSVTDWFTREDIIEGIKRELEAAAEQYAANDYNNEWNLPVTAINTNDMDLDIDIDVGVENIVQNVTSSPAIDNEDTQSIASVVETTSSCSTSSTSSTGTPISIEVFWPAYGSLLHQTKMIIECSTDNEDLATDLPKNPQITEVTNLTQVF